MYHDLEAAQRVVEEPASPTTVPALRGPASGMGEVSAAAPRLTAPVGSTRRALLHVISVSIASVLIIAVQPMPTILLQPATGSHPLLWHATQTAFQVLLLVGYVAAGTISARGQQVILWSGAAGAVCLPGLVLGAYVVDVLSPLRVFGLILVGFGAPLVALGTLSIVTQRQSAALGDSSPHWLYAASNAASLGAVFGYPLIVQPSVEVTWQLVAWRWLTAGVLAGTAAVNLIHPVALSRRPLRGQVTWCQIGYWTVSGAVAVGLMLSLTTYLAVDLGSHPLVWLGPFGMFLLSMSVSFSRAGLVVGRAATWLAPMGTAYVLFDLAGALPRPSEFVAYGFHLLALLIMLFAVHSAVVARRPEAADLGVFYAAITAGGTVAGAALAFGAPALLDPERYGLMGGLVYRTLFGWGVPEYAYFVLCVPFVMGVRPTERVARAIVFGVLAATVALLCVGVLRAASPPAWTHWSGLIGSMLILTLCFLPVRSSAKWSAALVVLFVSLASSALVRGGLVAHKRSAFGQLRIENQGSRQVLMHGSTRHGSQSLRCVSGTDDAECLVPMDYYAQEGPVGTLLTTERTRRERLDLMVIGLGPGVLASYCGPGDSLRFIEIDPNVAEIARTRFRYLESAGRHCGRLSVQIGDGRLAARTLPARSVDVLVADAFASDSVPVHLLTREAFGDYQRVLRTDGVLLLHVSNRYFDLAPVVLSTSASVGFKGVSISDPGSPRRSASRWVVLYFQAALEDRLDAALRSVDAVVEALGNRTGVVWSDYRYSVLDALRLRGSSRAQ
jgi:hypothetical protein